MLLYYYIIYIIFNYFFYYFIYLFVLIIYFIDPNYPIAFQSSDIDLFIYGLTAEEAIKKIETIQETILENVVEGTVVLRTNRTLTIAAGYPHRHIQIVLRLYQSPAEVLLGFDLDCVGVGYDGTDVWALPRTRRALNYRLNIADPSRQTYRTTSYEYRLWKYR